MSFIEESELQNKYLNYLLDNNPKRVISRKGIVVRRLISPLLRNIVAPMTSKNKYIIQKNKRLPKDKPIIFAATHGLKDDIAIGLCAGADILIYFLLHFLIFTEQSMVLLYGLMVLCFWIEKIKKAEMLQKQK